MNALELTNGKTQELHFGLRFVHDLNEIAGIKQSGVSFGFGLTRSLPALQAYDPEVLSNVVYAATAGNKPRCSQNDINTYLESLSGEDLDKLFEDVTKEVNESSVLQPALKNMKA